MPNDIVTFRFTSEPKCFVNYQSFCSKNICILFRIEGKFQIHWTFIYRTNQDRWFIIIINVEILEN